MKAVLERNLGFLGFPGYSIDIYGNVWSFPKNGNGYKILIKKPQKCFEYQRVELRNRVEQKLFRVHQLVALAFIPNPHGYKQINHKDGNPKNNHKDNLEWCDAEYNIQYTSDKLCGGKNKSIPVNVYKKDTHEFVGTFKSCNDAAIELGIYVNSIYSILKGYMKSTHGYVFEKVE